MTEVAVIMAGGYGERFWPMSRLNKPKQFLKVFSDHSMIRETYIRLENFLPPERIFIVTGEEYLEQTVKELPELSETNFIIEPFRRDTAAAIALSAIYVEKRFPGATMLICAADHIIKDVLQFRTIVQSGFKIARDTSCLLTLGIEPARPDTAYGYIEVGDVISEISGTGAYEVKRFVEKPDYSTAARYVDQGNFFWNSGMFIWEAQTLLEELSKHLPEHHMGMLEISESLGSPSEENVKRKVFEGLQKISIDYGIMEKSKNILCIKSTFDWDDVGSWTSLYRCLNVDDNNNIQSGKVMALNSRDT
ncbi:MAG: mannose-1-phosphate guanylyltransferase, partial [Spirochaetota bacterium]|nr:mannose-1-phosphate guanylyltransferase [Spirochaetota bacterium]